MRTKLSHIITVPRIEDDAVLFFGEVHKHIPFPIKRFYVISGVNAGAVRGLHAHRNLKQVLFCIKGSITFVLDNGSEREEIQLSEPNKGIFIDKWMWREMKEFSPDAVLLVLASELYDESDYIRNYGQFLAEVGKRRIISFPATFQTIRAVGKRIRERTAIKTSYAK